MLNQKAQFLANPVDRRERCFTGLVFPKFILCQKPSRNQYLYEWSACKKLRNFKKDGSWMLFGWFYVTKNQPKSMAPLGVLVEGVLMLPPLPKTHQRLASKGLRRTSHRPTGKWWRFCFSLRSCFFALPFCGEKFCVFVLMHFLCKKGSFKDVELCWKLFFSQSQSAWNRRSVLFEHFEVFWTGSHSEHLLLIARFPPNQLQTFPKPSSNDLSPKLSSSHPKNTSQTKTPKHPTNQPKHQTHLLHQTQTPTTPHSAWMPMEPKLEKPHRA